MLPQQPARLSAEVMSQTAITLAVDSHGPFFFLHSHTHSHQEMLLRCWQHPRIRTRNDVGEPGQTGLKTTTHTEKSLMNSQNGYYKTHTHTHTQNETCAVLDILKMIKELMAGHMC